MALLGESLQHLQMADYADKLLYLVFSRLYSRLFTKVPFATKMQTVGFRAEEAAAMCHFFLEHPASQQLQVDEHQRYLLEKITRNFHQKLE